METPQQLCFYGAAPSVAGALAVAEDDRRSWSLAGARGLSLLDALAPGGALSVLVMIFLSRAC